MGSLFPVIVILLLSPDIGYPQYFYAIFFLISRPI